VEKLCAALEAPGPPIVVCQLNDVIGLARPAESALWGRSREDQRAYDIANLAVIPTADAGVSDGIHGSAQGNIVPGERAGRRSAWQTEDRIFNARRLSKANGTSCFWNSRKCRASSSRQPRKSRPWPSATLPAERRDRKSSSCGRTKSWRCATAS
jgi:hypothetical protein